MKVPIQQIKCLFEDCKSLQLATINKDGTPLSSYAPFVLNNGRIYLFLSRLAQHFQNIEHASYVSVLLIRDESISENVFARERAEFNCTTRLLERDHSRATDLLDGFEERHGDTVQVLRGLNDFMMFELTPASGNYVEGFGKAFRLTDVHFLSEF
jgi:heme iron utilization protein